MCEGSGAEMIYSIMRMFSNFNYKLPCQEKLFIWPPFFQYLTDVFCAKKRAGHACICPRMTGQPVLELYPPPQEVGSSAAKTIEIPGGKTTGTAVSVCFSPQFFQAKIGDFCRLFFQMSRQFDFREQQAILPD